MTNKLANYLENLKNYLRIDSAAKDETIREISTHLEDSSQELKEGGLNEEEALRIATLKFGSVQSIAQEICEIHNQGSWWEAFFAALPHFLVATLLVSYYWQNTICLLLVLIATTCVVIYGWRHNQPVWLFPWLGYYLLPVIVTSILLIYLPQEWTWLAALVYIPLALFIVAYIVRQTTNRDWLYTLLMLVPILVVFIWLTSSGTGGQLLPTSAQLQANTLLLAGSFIILALATIAFIRAKQRWHKAVALLISASLILFSLALENRANIGLGAGTILILSLLILVTPAWVQLKPQPR
jgi:hypothetical protein